MSIYEKLDIPKEVYEGWKESIEAFLKTSMTLNFEKLQNNFMSYTIEKYFIEYSILKDLEAEYKDNELFKTWFNALKEAIAKKNLRGLKFV